MSAATKACRFLAALWFGALAAGAGTANAEERADPAPTEREIDEAVCQDNQRADRWNVAWAVTFSIAAAGTGGLAVFSPPDWFTSDTRAGLYVTAGKATVAAVLKLVRPLEIDVEGLCRDDQATSAERRHALLANAAERERLALIPNVVGGLLLNSVGLLYLGWARDDWRGAWISFGVGAGATVASTLTAPTQSWLLRRRLDKSRHVAALPMLNGGTAGLTVLAAW